MHRAIFLFLLTAEFHYSVLGWIWKLYHCQIWWIKIMFKLSWTRPNKASKTYLLCLFDLSQGCPETSAPTRAFPDPTETGLLPFVCLPLAVPLCPLNSTKKTKKTYENINTGKLLWNLFPLFFFLLNMYIIKVSNCLHVWSFVAFTFYNRGEREVVIKILISLRCEEYFTASNQEA